MKKVFPLLLGVFLLGFVGCQSQPEPTPTEIPSITATQTSTLTPSPTATQTATPTMTASSTLTPSTTPSPTPTSIIQSKPVDVDVAEPVHMDRPQLSGFVRYVDTNHFRIFYTMSGEDAVQVEDDNGNGLPDYVELVAEALEHSWEIETQYLGWAEPPPDSNLGGDEKFDVYLEDLDMYIAGYVSGGEPANLIHDNPNTDVTEETASFSHMGLDNDFAEIDSLEDIQLSGLDFMRTTVAHELNHAIQYGYDSKEPHHWFWEASATWVETYVYEDIKDSEFHLRAAFKSPDTCLLDYGGYDRIESGGHWYALWVFLRFMSEELGVTIIRDIWQETIELDGYEAFEAALNDYSTNLDEVYRGYTIALLLRNFEFELDFPTVRLEGAIEGLESWAPNDGVGQMAADFIEIRAPGIVEIAPWNLYEGVVVGIQDDEAHIYNLNDGKTVVNTDEYEHVYLIMLNLTRAESMQDCKMTQYRVRVLKGENPLNPDLILPADQFEQPAVEPLEDIHARD